jgi:hypothetical protein
MSHDRIGGASVLRGAAAVATTFALMLGVLAPAIAADTATFSGAVVGTDNSLGEHFTVIYKDVATGQEFRSGPTNAAGEYQVSVPVGARYKLDSVLAPDGTKLPVQNVPPIRVAASGTNRVDVKFTQATAAAKPAVAAPAAAAAGVTASAGPAAPKPVPPAGSSTPAASSTPKSAPAAAPATASAAAPEKEKEKKDKGAVPWWKKPGPIVGMVLGGVAIGALALGGGGGDNNNTASASLP